MATPKKTAATKETTAPKPAPQVPDWYVVDTNANHPSCEKDSFKRLHTVGGVNYMVTGQLPGTAMPPNHAVFFLKDRSFEVYDSNHERQEPLRANTSGGALAKHEVIATLYELRKDALLKRAAKHQGGAVLNANTPVEKIIEFLLTVDAPARQTTQRPAAIKGVSQQASTLLPEADDDVELDGGESEEAGEAELSEDQLELDEDGGKGFLPPQPADLGAEA